MHGLPQLVNDGKHLFSSLARIILIFAAIVCLGQLLATYALFRKTKSDEPLSFTIVAAMQCPGLAKVVF
jgi:Kef-type K+ transport system membrane component KefB